MNYKSVESFMSECIMFTHEEKKEIINDAKILEVDIIDYINFEVESLMSSKKAFENGINSVLDNDY